jgi:serine/threonine-protein kinase
MDWGIAKPVGAPDRAPIEAAPSGRVTSTHAGAVVGTPAYMSPEQARGEAVDARSDVFALCVLFHELLCARHYLHDRTTIESVLEGVQNAPAHVFVVTTEAQRLPVPMDLAWFVTKGLKKDPAQRYQSVREMIDRLDARDEGDIPIQCPLTFTKRMTGLWLGFVDRHPMLFPPLALATILATLAFMTWSLVRWVHG